MPSVHRSLALVVAVVVVSLVPAVALAQRLPSGAVLDLEGRRATARAMRIAVVEGAESHLALVGVAELRASARAQGASLDGLSGVRDVADALDLEVVVGGRVEGRGRRASVSLYALDRRGTELATREVAHATRSSVRAASRSIAEEAVSVLEARRAEARERRERRESAAVARAERRRSTERAAARRSGEALLDADLGLGLATRSATIALASGGERRYDGGLHPELSIRAEARPFRGSSGALRGVVVGLEGATAVAARSWSSGEESEEIDTSAWRLSASVGYRFAAGPVEIGPTLGWGLDVFELGTNQVMPSASYHHLRIGGGARLSLLDGLLRIHAAGGYRYVLSAGDIVEAFGDRTSVGGYDLSAGAVVRPVGGLRIGLDLGMTRYGLAFDGSGEGANATEGSDSRLRATLFAGWSLP